MGCRLGAVYVPMLSGCCLGCCLCAVFVDGSVLSGTLPLKQPRRSENIICADNADSTPALPKEWPTQHQADHEYDTQTAPQRTPRQQASTRKHFPDGTPYSINITLGPYDSIARKGPQTTHPQEASDTPDSTQLAIRQQTDMCRHHSDNTQQVSP